MTALVALLFSLIAPGAGHALTGHWGQAILIGGIFALGKNALLPLSFRLGRVRTLKRALRFLYVCNWCYIALIFYAVISAFWYGFYTQEMYILRACLFAAVVILVQKNTKSKFIFTALCGRAGMWELVQKIYKSPTEEQEK